MKDKARAEVLQDRERNAELVRAALDSTATMTPDDIEEMRDFLLLQREIQAHKLDPAHYAPPRAEHDMEGPNNVALALSKDSEPWPFIEGTRREAARVIEVGHRFGMGQDDDRGGYEAGRDFFPALADRMHLTAVLAKCGEFCARAEAFVKNTIARMRGLDRSALLDQDKLWPLDARAAVARNETALGLRAPTVQVEPDRTAERETPRRTRDRDDDHGLTH